MTRPKNRIHVGDTLDLLGGLPAESCDLVVADPPYFLSVDEKFGVDLPFKTLDQWVEWCGRWLAAAIRALTDRGNLFVYGIHNYAPFLHVSLVRSGMCYRRQIIWHYENGWSQYRNAPAAQYEPILWFSKEKKSYYDPIREPYKSAARLKYPVKKNGKVWRPHPDGRLAGDVWKFPTLAGRRFRDEKVDHPTQKPLALSRRIVRHFCPPEGTVLVPFVGSGTECVAAKQLGRHFLGAELNPDYVAVAESRLRDIEFGSFSEQGRLFAAASAPPPPVSPDDRRPEFVEPSDVTR